ncbi:MAG: hypothetical protein JXK94_15605 [Deltaproteobacteria bacterium]|nr:hypothetical protein [Deltaproteobacteria bacterium]
MTSANHTIECRFYEELNDHLPPHRRKHSFTVDFKGEPAAGELIAALGVPLDEVDLLLVNGESTVFERRLKGGERVAVYPLFEQFDITPIVRLPGRPLCPKFH